MTENQNVDADAQAGAEGTPSPDVSQQAQTPIDGDVTKLLAGLESKFAEKFSSLEKQVTGLGGVQSRIDQSQNAFQAQLAKLNQYKSQGMSEPEALAEMESDDRAEQRWTSLEQKLDQLAGRIASGGTAQNEQQSVAKVFEAVGLDPKDPRVAVALTKRYENTDQVELAAYRLQKDLAQSPNPSPAQDASLNGQANLNAVNLDALSAEYNTLVKDPAANLERMSEIKKELDSLK